MFPDTITTPPEAFCAEFGMSVRVGHTLAEHHPSWILGLAEGVELNQIQSHRMMRYYASNNCINLDFLRYPVQKYVSTKPLTNSHLIKHSTPEVVLGAEQASGSFRNSRKA